MAVNLAPPTQLSVVGGVELATGCAGIKSCERDDVALITLAAGSVASAVFTQSTFSAAPVRLARAHLSVGSPRALLVNSGNANAATGVQGEQDALACCEAVALALGVKPSEVLPFSTGVIGERLPVAALTGCIESLGSMLSPDGWMNAARAIMTTDTVPKAVSSKVEIDGCEISLTGIAKGSGMIRPDMATMLAFLVTDAAISGSCLDVLVDRANQASFSRISVDGDTSTNDSFVVIATGASGLPVIDDVDDPKFASLQDAVTKVAALLAQAIIRDGEGATKFVSVIVQGGRNSEECLEVAFTVAESPLVKTALFAGDPNWGRFCMAIGRADVPDLDAAHVSLWLDDVRVARDGMIDPGYVEDAGAAVMLKEEFALRIDLGRGAHQETVWTSDLSYEYVRINAEYRS